MSLSQYLDCILILVSKACENISSSKNIIQLSPPMCVSLSASDLCLLPPPPMDDIPPSESQVGGEYVNVDHGSPSEHDTSAFLLRLKHFTIPGGTFPNINYASI
ncbi:hypothetical protein B0H19DRAFT_1274454 [Mycena capillaripes]|nr:hypothetical protein B0H19DRAFT_1274454 [Mycena capillaripes]